jgi:hypothetical protein
MAILYYLNRTNPNQGECMMNPIFCPKCGASDQRPESYCRRCGQWLLDIDAPTQPRIFRKKTREEKIRKMRILEVVSAALAFTSAAIIFSVLSGSGDTSLLNLAGICCIIIAVYQAVNFYFGYTLQPKRNKDHVQGGREIEVRTKDLPHALDGYGDGRFIEMPTVTENTTELLRPKRREGQPGELK